MSDFHTGVTRATAAMRRRFQMMVGRGVISSVDDGKLAQALQVELLADEAHDGVERFQDYGFTSVPYAGAEAVMVSVGGLRSHGIVVAIEDRRYRLTGLPAGEVALYDDQGQVVHLTRDGILIETTKKLEVKAASVLVEADAVDLGGAGGKAVARIDDMVDLATGKIISGSPKVKAA